MPAVVAKLERDPDRDGIGLKRGVHTVEPLILPAKPDRSGFEECVRIVTQFGHQSTLLHVQPLSFQEARSAVIREVISRRVFPAMETVPLRESAGRVLAVDAAADRPYPPFDRAMRDGFAVRAEDLPGTLRVVGEVRAGEWRDSELQPGEAVEIMTGAPVPAGANAVVMVEHSVRHDGGSVTLPDAVEAGLNIAPMGSEAKQGEAGVARGTRINHAAVSWLASVGIAEVPVYRQLRVAILATGDELVEVTDAPLPHQIRNSNSYSIAAQVERAGAIPVVLPVARDTIEETRALVAQGLEADLLLLSGGVSAGKYDVVEAVLAEFGAEFFFDRVRIQPGAPLVFGYAMGKFFFGLPGNPGSTMATFELFARAALDLLSGMDDAPLPLAFGQLTQPFQHKPGLTRFLPAVVRDGKVTPKSWKGSGDVPAVARVNAYLVADAEKSHYAEGEYIPILFQ